ncbi:Ger(x)C family spore germination protein [Gorillibacterium sp. sgz500922]|uniref:Ger(x)C family spore germination protein n=1 Tax=Gorillibacterium sp. sgz500922 TaxID=3446694 RepID=UPI003F66D088
MRTRIVRGIAGLAALVVLGGCWDQTEIEQRGFVVGTALDQADEGQIRVTYQMAVPKAMQKPSEQDGGSSKPFLNLSATARTDFGASRDMANETSRPPYLEHNRVILISEALAREGNVSKVLDVYVRDAETRRAAKVMITKGEASPLFNILPQTERLPAEYIDSTAENPRKTGSITPATNIGDVHRFLLEKASFALPVVTGVPKENKIVLSGSAVFNGEKNQLRGFLDGEETTGRNMLTGSIRSTTIETEVYGKNIVFELKKLRRSIRADVTDPHRPSFRVNLHVFGNLGESHLEISVFNERVIGDAERAIAKKIRDMAEAALEKSQTELGSDIFKFGEELERNHPAVWKGLRNDWDRGEGVFKTCRVQVNVDVQASMIGAILKTE